MPLLQMKACGAVMEWYGYTSYKLQKGAQLKKVLRAMSLLCQKHAWSTWVEYVHCPSGRAFRLTMMTTKKQRVALQFAVESLWQHAQMCKVSYTIKQCALSSFCWNSKFEE